MIDWNEHLLGDLLQFQRGFDITAKEQQPGNIPVISSSGITSYHNRAMVKGPGIVTGRKGSLGKVHFVRGDYWPHDTTLWVKDFKGNNPKFLYYLLQQIHLETYDVGASNPTLNRNHLHKIRLQCPPPPVQQKIAAILSAYDDLIENNNKRIALLEKAAEEIYREWFVRMRFPGWEQVKFVKDVPEDWDVGSFTDFIDVMSGGTPKTDIPQYWGDEIPWFTPRDLKGSFLVFDTERKITEDGLRHCASKLYPPNTVFITARGTVGNCVMNVVPMAMSQTSYALLGKNNLPQYFIYYLTLNMVATLKQQATGAVFDTIIVDTFRKQNVAIPTKSILDKYTILITPILEQLKTLLKKNELLGSTRDLLLARLISGKLPVDDLDIRFPPSMVEEGGAVRVRAVGGAG